MKRFVHSILIVGVLAAGAAGCSGFLNRSLETPERMERVLVRFDRGLKAIEREDTKSAIAIFDALSREYPNVSVFQHNLGVAHKKNGEIEKAEEAYRRSLDLNRGHAESHYNLAIILRERGLFREAERHYAAAVRISPAFRDAHYNLAILYDLFLDRPDDALRHYRRYIDLGGPDRELVEIWIAGLDRRIAKSGEAP